MEPSGPRAPRPAELYEEDEEGNRVRGSSRSARTRHKEEKERRRPKVSHRSSDKKHSKSDSGVEAPGYGTQAMMSGARQDDAMDQRGGITTVERRRSSAGTSSKSKKYDSSKSPSKSKSSGRTDEAKYYGVSGASNAMPTTVMQPLPIRTRPTVVTAQSYPARPNSFHQNYSATGYGPPISNAAFWQHQPGYYPPLSQSATFAPSNPSPLDYPSPSPVATRPLSSRFGTPTRTGSGFGFRDHNPPVIQQRLRDDYEDGYASAAEVAPSRTSIRNPSDRQVFRTQAEIDALNMPPPPPRPTAGRPGPSILRRTTDYPLDLPTAPPEPEYQPREGRTYQDERRPRRSSVNRLSGAYEYNDRRVEAANSGRRRQSYYGQSASMGSGASGGNRWEDKAAQATSYQDGVSGSASASAVPLTADLLRRQQRRQGGSSRSTKSSGSRDESDYRKSATTRTTRSVSSPEDENVTIKVTGQARVVVDGAQIDCDEGGEIEIKREKSLKGSHSVRGGSEWSSSEYCGGGPRRIDDRNTRVDRPAGQSRRRSSSYARPSPPYQTGGFF